MLISKLKQARYANEKNCDLVCIRILGDIIMLQKCFSIINQVKLKMNPQNANHVYLSGNLISYDQILAPLSLFGYGAFTSIKYSSEGFLFLEKHFDRLKYNCHELKINYPGDYKIVEAIKSLLIANNLFDSECIIRVTLFPEELNWANPQNVKDSKSSILVTTRQMYHLPLDFSMKTVRMTRNMPHLKTTNYVVNMLAKAEARELGYYDALFVSQEGLITEGTASNIFFIQNDNIYTPNIDVGLLEGITRATVIQLCKDLNISLIPSNIGINKLKDFQSAFITNASQGAHPVELIDDYKFDTSHPLLTQIKCAYDKLPKTKLFEI